MYIVENKVGAVDTWMQRTEEKQQAQKLVKSQMDALNKAIVIVNGVEVVIDLTDEQKQEISQQQRNTGCMRRDFGESYYYVLTNGITNGIVMETETGTTKDAALYDTANYYTVKDFAEWSMRYETVQRKLRRYALENNKKKVYYRELDAVYTVGYEEDTDAVVCVECVTGVRTGVVTFSAVETATAAIELYKEELLWVYRNWPQYC